MRLPSVVRHRPARPVARTQRFLLAESMAPWAGLKALER